MKPIRHWGWALVASLLLFSACGGSEEVPGSGSPAGAPTEKGSFAAVVSFGTSVSDVGTYTPATSATGDGRPPFIGGKFTTNGPGATVWVENVAAALGLAVTPAEVGFDGQSVKCPAAADPALAGTCTGYGQGGALVTDPNGINHNPDGSGALTVPIRTQIANHLARFGSFRDSDLVFVEAGLNDVFVQIAAFAAAAGQVSADAQAGRITADQANALLFQAQSKGQAAMKQAALELSGYVRDEILAKGARYVAVMNAVDLSLTPEGRALPEALRPVLTGLSDVFNLWLREGLTGQPVQIIDLKGFFAETVANPAARGFVVASERACDPAAIAAITHGAVTSGTSLFCNDTPGAPYNGLAAGADPVTWFFADGNHPTTGGHKALSDVVLQQLRAYGWI
jgi:phospholipase/lecithinase/hemolysin